MSQGEGAVDVWSAAVSTDTRRLLAADDGRELLDGLRLLAAEAGLELGATEFIDCGVGSSRTFNLSVDTWTVGLGPTSLTAAAIGFIGLVGLE